MARGRHIQSSKLEAQGRNLPVGGGGDDDALRRLCAHPLPHHLAQREPGDKEAQPHNQRQQYLRPPPPAPSGRPA